MAPLRLGAVTSTHSMGSSLHVLIVDDSESDAKQIVAALSRAGRTIDHQRVESPDALRAALNE